MNIYLSNEHLAFNTQVLQFARKAGLKGLPTGILEHDLPDENLSFKTCFLRYKISSPRFKT